MSVEYKPWRPAVLKLPTAQRVREARAQYDLSPDEAAELVHVTTNAWYKWEAGTRQMDLARWELFLIKAQEYTP